MSFGILSHAQDTRLIQLEALISQRSVEIKGLQETVELDLNSTDVNTLLTAVARVHEMNMVIAPELKRVTIENTFNEVKVADLLLYLAKEYSLDYSFVGDIITVKIYKKPEVVINNDRTDVNYDLARNYISLDLNNADLEDVFRTITNQTGKNLLYDNNLKNKSLSIFLKDVPFKKGLEQLALGNGLEFSESEDGFYLFSAVETTTQNSGGNRRVNKQKRNFEYTIIDTLRQQLKVNFKDAPVEDIITTISEDLGLGVFLASPLSGLGNASIKANSISYEELLRKIFDSQQGATASPVIENNSRSTNQNNASATAGNSLFTFKREGDLFFYGTVDQLSLRTLELVPLKYRSIEVIQDQDVQMNNISSSNRGFNNSTGFNNNNRLNNQNTNQNFNNQTSRANNNSDIVRLISDLMPDDVIESLNIKVDKELNSFVVSGPADKVVKFKQLINAIDKPVPVVLIETMIIEINRTSTVDTGIEWGLGDAPTRDSGSIFPNTDLTLGSNTVNRVLGGLEGFTSLNLGRVVPNFFVNLKAMETNGDISIKSSPKLSVLNGHEAQLSIGQTTYYVITQRDIIGSQNPQLSTVVNYQPIDAELGIFIKPMVSSEGEITMGIVVNQSSFTGVRIAADAPPDINTRQFTSTVRVRDKDIIVLGGLEDIIKSDTGSGVPFLARIPLIKYLFSRRTREGTKKKLAVLIRPTVIK